MEADSNQLDDDFLSEVQSGANKDRNDDLVEIFLPFSYVRLSVQVVMDHGREEGDQNSKPPEENGCWDFKLLSKVPPFLAVVGE